MDRTKMNPLTAVSRAKISRVNIRSVNIRSVGISSLSTIGHIRPSRTQASKVQTAPSVKAPSVKERAKTEQLDIEQHTAILEMGVAIWNQWRVSEPFTIPNLQNADLSGLALENVNLAKANLRGTKLDRAYLYDADF
ncbi:MAG: pentapeptide repeat-containing protein, partial [Cyanobacteria bacterium J06576_12]